MDEFNRDLPLSEEQAAKSQMLKFHHSICYTFGCRFINDDVTSAQAIDRLPACTYPGGISHCPLNVVRGAKRENGLFFAGHPDVPASFKHLTVFKLVVDSLQPYSPAELAAMAEPDVTMLDFIDRGGFAPKRWLKIVFAASEQFFEKCLIEELNLQKVIYFKEDLGVTIPLQDRNPQTFCEIIARLLEENELKVERLKLDKVDENSLAEVVSSFNPGDEQVALEIV